MEQIQEFENEARNDLIEGRNAVMEALRAGRTIDKIFIAKGDVDKTLGHIASKARSAGIVVTEADRRKLDAMSQTHAHQGVIALCAVKEYSTIEDMLAIAAERGEAPFLVLCDEISDPHNLGAIIRTAECVGAHGVIIPIKVKYLAYVDAALFVLGIVTTSFPLNLLPVVAVLNYLVYCGDWLFDFFRPSHVRQRQKTVNFKREARRIQREQANKPYHYKCAVCGRTDVDHPELEFRYCSRCVGYHCFCQDHINNHVHFTE